MSSEPSNRLPPATPPLPPGPSQASFDGATIYPDEPFVPPVVRRDWQDQAAKGAIGSTARAFRHQYDLAEYLEAHRKDLDVNAPLPPRKESLP